MAGMTFRNSNVGWAVQNIQSSARYPLLLGIELEFSAPDKEYLL